MISQPALLSQGGSDLQARCSGGCPAARRAATGARKAVKLLAKAHQKVRRQRQDFHHKTALALGARVRHDLSRGLADGQHGQESPPRQEHQRRGWSEFLEHPELQGSMRRSLSRSRAACLHHASLFRLRRPRPERLVRPLALVPGLRDEPASGPQRRPEHPGWDKNEVGPGRPLRRNAARWGVRSLRISRL